MKIIKSGLKYMGIMIIGMLEWSLISLPFSKLSLGLIMFISFILMIPIMGWTIPYVEQFINKFLEC